MNIRTFQPGDEAVQVAIYNEAAAALPKFKPSTVPEVQRRTRATDFDPNMRFFAEEGGRAVGYALFNPNGRVSYPWCLKGHEKLAEPLFEQVMAAMRQRGMRQAFAAYRGDWSNVGDFFRSHGFRQAREMVNFIMEAVDMPTVPARPSTAVATLRRDDVPALLQLAPQALRARTPAELEKHLFANPYFGPEAVFLLRARSSDAPVAAGILITDSTYAEPAVLDANMPCFRLGAFGSEGMQAKRVKGLFSVLLKADANANMLALDLLGQASFRLQQTDDIDTLAAQVPSDAPHLLQFYQRIFRRQGAFPVFERPLSAPGT